MKTVDAVKFLCKEIKSDMDLRRAWHANVSMAFQDEYSRCDLYSPNDEIVIRDVANKAADHFLNSMCGLPRSKTTQY